MVPAKHVARVEAEFKRRREKFFLIGRVEKCAAQREAPQVAYSRERFPSGMNQGMHAIVGYVAVIQVRPTSRWRSFAPSWNYANFGRT